MAPILYSDALSPCARSVLITALYIDVDLDVKTVDLAKGEFLNPDFVKKFPMHTVPSLEDDGLLLWDSHAIMTYLVSAYAKDDKLYPKDPKKRSKVDQWLHFDSGILYPRLRAMSEPLWARKLKVVPEEVAHRAEAGFQLLEDQLGNGPWLCGESITLADISCVCTVLSTNVFLGDAAHYPKLMAWIEHSKKNMKGYKEINEANNDRYGFLIRKMLEA